MENCALLRSWVLPGSWPYVCPLPGGRNTRGPGSLPQGSTWSPGDDENSNDDDDEDDGDDDDDDDDDDDFLSVEHLYRILNHTIGY